MECKREQCLSEWKEYVSDEEKNARGYSEGGYTFVHCEMKDCHTLYPKGKNGSTCEYCEKEVCEGCGDDGVWEDDYEYFYCSRECFEGK